MKSSLSVRLVSLMASTILISSLAATLLISSLTSQRFRHYALERDRNTARTIAGYLSSAAEQGRLREIIQALPVPQAGRPQSPPARSSMMKGARPGMMGMMRTGGGETVPFLVTDREGRVLKSNFPAGELLSQGVSPLQLSDGEPYYGQDRRIAGYVLAGSMLRAGLPDNEAQYLRSLLLGILMSAILAAFLASAIGFVVLRKILAPLRSLNRGVRLLGNGDYSYRVDHPGREDELSQLAEGFNAMADSLRASEQWKKQIISDTAHELRTPVSLIMGNLEMMMEGVYQADEERLQSLYEESALLAGLIKDLQVLATAESAAAVLERESFSPDELIRLTAEGFRAVAREKGLALEAEASFGGLWQGDRRKIQQVLKNLLSNGVRHTPEQGRITLRSRKSGAQLLLEVEDSGPGIPEEERSRVFDRFYRLDASRNREEGGAGLGLAISKAIVDLHGGTIDVLRGDAGGALFRVILPA